MSILLFLDDIRDPFDKVTDWLVFSPIPKDELTEVVWVKSYKQFVNYIEDFEVPDAICFDNDLNEEHYNAQPKDFKNPDNLHNIFKEKTGYCCAKYLIEYCQLHQVKLPKWNCQSANPIGKENINNLLNNYLKYEGKNYI